MFKILNMHTHRHTHENREIDHDSFSLTTRSNEDTIGGVGFDALSAASFSWQRTRLAVIRASSISCEVFHRENFYIILNAKIYKTKTLLQYNSFSGFLLLFFLS